MMSTSKEIESVMEVPDNDGNPAYYIVNYESEGFIILSADNRVAPIRAFSTTDNFSLNSIYPSGLVQWLSETSDLIGEIRSLNEEQTDGVSQTWEICQMQGLVEPGSFDDPLCSGGSGGSGSGSGSGGCQDQYWEYGPLLTTVWGQRDGYNDLAPNLGCADDLNGQAPTGCVATAMAQVMNYHQFPTGYNYAGMPNTRGTLATARLMRDIGDAVDMDWGCTESSAVTKKEVASSFVDDFGYSSATYADFDQEILKQQIRWNKPVILRGGHRGGGLFPTYEGGHAWVCDGYKRWVDCESGYGYLYLNMNWGWSRDDLNGWYSYNNWSVNGRSYNYKQGMVYNITP